MQIVDISFFKDLNYLHIPLSVNDPTEVLRLTQRELDYLCEN
jgi:hypothetical protein